MLAFTARNHKLVWKNRPLPKLRNGWALIRVRLAGICNTDVEILRGYHNFRGTPGHEFIGEVADLCGVSAATKKKWLGQRVCGEISASCSAYGFRPVCRFCKRALRTHCERRTVLGIVNHDGAFAEYIALPVENLHIVPDNITDDRPGSPLAVPAAPGRPSTLRFKGSGSGRAKLPGMHRLDQERERGRLLHFFANHELLATELMALVLLKFPDAPTAFRKGVLQTLKDEQMHTRLYIERMKQCGIQFGDLPVSGYFWRSVSGMENPMDYVTALSLTFEQANLDFCRYFAAGFAKVGDEQTARLLERIYRDVRVCQIYEGTSDVQKLILQRML